MLYIAHRLFGEGIPQQYFSPFNMQKQQNFSWCESVALLHDVSGSSSNNYYSYNNNSLIKLVFQGEVSKGS